MKIDQISKNVTLFDKSENTALKNKALKAGTIKSAWQNEQKISAKIDFSKKSLEYSRVLTGAARKPLGRLDAESAPKTYSSLSKNTARFAIHDANNLYKSHGLLNPKHPFQIEVAGSITYKTNEFTRGICTDGTPGYKGQA